jgi:2-dehydropantoate 2-reductase
MKILVLGAGSLGSVFGGFLAKNGHRVTLFGREHCINPVNNCCLFIEGFWGDHHITNIKGYSSLNKIIQTEGRSFDLTLLTVKSYDTKELINRYLQTFGCAHLTVSLQNGLGNLETIAEILGKDKAIGGRVIFGAELIEPGRVKVTVYADKVILGSLDDSVPFKKVKEIATLFDNAGIPAAATDDIQKALWGKVLYNGTLNALSCLLEVNYGKLMENAHTKSLIQDIIREFFALTQKKGLEIDWNSAEEYTKELFEHLIPATSDHFSSMLQDIRSGKKTEIDSINGKVLAMADNRNIDLPVNRVLTALVKAKKLMHH